MKFSVFVFLLLAILFTIPQSNQAQKIAADLILVNANVRTMDANQASAEAIAVLGNKIIAVGKTDEIRALAGANTKIIDAKGKLVLPGFNDSHVHFLSGGFQLASVDLRNADSPQEFADRIRKFAQNLSKGRWITGGDWDHERWTPANLPTKELIDAFTADTPVFVQRLDGHMALANSAALKLAGVDRNTKDVAGGEIVRDRDGNPTGVLKDAAMNYVYKVVPEAAFAEKLQAAEAATNHAASFGVTSVQDVSAGNDVGVYQELLRQNKLKTRIYAVSPLYDWQRLAKTGVRAAFGDQMLRIGGLKGFADGSLGSTTALFFEPYRDAPNTSGLGSDELPQIRQNVLEADKAGLQIMIHAIGDRANNEILRFFAEVEATNGARDRRFRIEHAQHIRLGDIKRFGQQKVVASMQPFHAIDDGRWAEKRIGKERSKGTYAFRSLLDNNAVLAFGSDWTVAPISPLIGIYAAVTRRTLDGKNPNGWVPEQKITVEEAVRAYTIGSAYAEFQENVKGTIASGKLADFVMLSDDIFAINPNDIEKTRVLMTVVDGRVVYEVR